MLVLLKGFGPDLTVPGGWFEAAAFNGLQSGIDVSAALQAVYNARRSCPEGLLDAAITLLGGSI